MSSYKNTLSMFLKILTDSHLDSGGEIEILKDEVAPTPLNFRYDQLSRSRNKTGKRHAVLPARCVHLTPKR